MVLTTRVFSTPIYYIIVGCRFTSNFTPFSRVNMVYNYQVLTRFYPHNEDSWKKKKKFILICISTLFSSPKLYVIRSPYALHHTGVITLRLSVAENFKFLILGEDSFIYIFFSYSFNSKLIRFLCSFTPTR